MNDEEQRMRDEAVEYLLHSATEDLWEGYTMEMAADNMDASERQLELLEEAIKVYREAGEQAVESWRLGASAAHYRSFLKQED